MKNKKDGEFVIFAFLLVFDENPLSFLIILILGNAYFHLIFLTVGVPITHPSNILLPKPSKNEALEQVLQLSFDCLKKYCKLKKLERFLYGSIVIFQRMHVFRPSGVEA